VCTGCRSGEAHGGLPAHHRKVFRLIAAYGA
jgi:hypothetical protein